MTSTIDQQIDTFLAAKSFAVAGASAERSKYGNKVLRVYLQHKKTVYPLNPKGGTIEGLQAYATIADLPEPIEALSIITKPAITREVVEQAILAGIQQIWMQPGAEDAEAIERAKMAGINVIHGGPCVLVALGFHDVS